MREFFESEIKKWDLARENYIALGKVLKKPFRAGELRGYVQYNPARSVSTLAKVDKLSLEKRPCFLCASNRPDIQKSKEILPGYELLINPFPILPYHFTIASKDHTPQILDISTGKKLAELLPGMVVFFNSEGAGASAPDHLHYQCVPLGQLPLINLINEKKDKGETELILPFKIIEADSYTEKGKPLNAFFWKYGDENRSIIIPRKAHRPKEYFLDSPARRAVSPGAIDMAGVIVTPIKEDFEAIDEKDIMNIYQQVALSREY